MIDITLKAGERFPISATSKYLIVRSVGDGVWLLSRGQAEVQLQSADVVEVKTNQDLTLVNRSSLPQVVKYQISPFKIDTKAQSLQAEITNTSPIEVQMPQGVSIGSVAQNGEWNVAVLSATVNTHKARIECLAGQATKLFSAGVRKSNRINIRSDQFNGVSLGGDNTVNDNSGGFLDVGMVDYMDTSGELWAFNNGASPVYVDVLELV